jgi:primosomal protein N' (replication factor Y)
MAQSIIQVAGRAGRAGRAGKVLIQTAFPNNNFWHTLFNGGYKKIAEIGLDERKNTSWPPFTYLALIRSSAFQYSDAYNFLSKLKIYLSKNKNLKLKILGPVEAPMARKAGRHRAQLLLQSIDRLTLHHSLDTIRIKMESDTLSRKTRWSIDVDPIELL